VAVIFDSEVPSQPPYLQAIETAAPSFGVRLTFADVHNAADIERAISAFAQQPNGSLIVVPNPLTIVDRDHIITLAARHSLPAMYPYRFFASSGGLMSYGIDLADQYRRAASYVDAILKGAKPRRAMQLSARKVAKIAKPTGSKL
jgi:putative ABC transport system substrate-binding protein